MPTADLLLVTVTKTETRAVFQCFREATGQDARPQVVGDKTYHDLGTVNGTGVWLVQSEMGAAGLGASLQTVQKSLETLTPSAVVMVGIAFGVDSGKQSIGDVLVAKQLMMYDPQRVGKDSVVPRGSRVDCSPRLLDRCRNADLSWEGATVRFGLVLSGEKLVDNVEFRQSLLHHEPEAIGGEMEGAGLYVACHDVGADWLLVKAICDWADGEKGVDKNMRQATAARNAATFVLHTLKTVGLKIKRELRTEEDRRVLQDRVGLSLVDQVSMNDGGISIDGNVGGNLTIHHNAAPASATSTPTTSSLPNQPYFFGREEELQSIADAIAPDARTWGVLIDGPGGIGKTALALRAAYLAPSADFALKIFLSAKARELTPQGEQPLEDFMLPNYMTLLRELALELGETDIAKGDPNERANTVRRALAGQRALIVIDNLETFDERERARVFQFLARLPEGNKAIVTSRRRTDVAAHIIRLDRLAQADALALLDVLAKHNKTLARTIPAERQALYEITHGNPLLLQWTAGQLGRGRCRTVVEACEFLKAAPANNEPLEYIFGDLVEAFTGSETKVLAALSHFTQPAKVEWLADMASLPRAAVETALEDLTDRSLLVTDSQLKTFLLPPLVAVFLRRKRPEVANETGKRLTDQVYALALENGYQNYDHFPVLEAAWPRIAAALPLFVTGANDRLQIFCSALDSFLNFSGRWDEQLTLSEQAEAKAEAVKNFDRAGRRAYDAGYVCYLRGRAMEVLHWATRAEAHWQRANARTRERAIAISLRGLGHRLNKNYFAAITVCSEALSLWRTLRAESIEVTIALNSLAGVKHASGDYAAAERDYSEALRIARKLNHQEGIITCISNLAELAIDRKQWAEAERLAQEALRLAEKIGQQALIGSSFYHVARALLQQAQNVKAQPYAQRAVDVFVKLRHPDLEKARAVLAACEGSGV